MDDGGLRADMVPTIFMVMLHDGPEALQITRVDSVLRLDHVSGPPRPTPRRGARLLRTVHASREETSFFSSGKATRTRRSSGLVGNRMSVKSDIIGSPGTR